MTPGFPSHNVSNRASADAVVFGHGGSGFSCCTSRADSNHIGVRQARAALTPRNSFGMQTIGVLVPTRQSLRMGLCEHAAFASSISHVVTLGAGEEVCGVDTDRAIAFMT